MTRKLHFEFSNQVIDVLMKDNFIQSSITKTFNLLNDYLKT